jgi:branched-subunit amino acid aminotransferase/4-amino-4-deoxychorismate lyase
MNYCIVGGHLVEAEKAVVSIQDRGFRYGDGVFETLAVQDGVPYQFDWHLRRLADGLRAIRIECEVGAIYESCKALLKKNNVKNGLLRIQVTRGIGSIGYLPDQSHAKAGPTIVIETGNLPEVPAEAISLWLSSYAKISAHALPVQYKLAQGLNSTLARMEANENHCFEALLLNEEGQLCETSSGNLFWLKGNRLYTPALSCGLLEGATRAAIIRLSPYLVDEVEAGIEALADADAVFITNVIWHAIPVSRLLPVGESWDSRTVAQEFRTRLAEDCTAYCHAHSSEW